MYDLLVVGGGAAGYFGAIRACELSPIPLKVAILEAGRRALQKVRISGGGRCNVTHAEFDPKELTNNYPRGQRELRGPFTRFAPGDTMAWFEDRGVDLKIEDDGRVFPVSDDSASIVQVLQRVARGHGIELLLGKRVTSLHAAEDGAYYLGGKSFSLSAKQVLFAPGSSAASVKLLGQLGVSLVAPVPSLFTFNVDEPALTALMGLSVAAGRIRVPAIGVETRGPVLITHWGLSGPAVLRASAEGAIGLHARRYDAGFSVSWLDGERDDITGYVANIKRGAGGKTVSFSGGSPVPKRLWQYLLRRAHLRADERWADLNAAQIGALVDVLVADTYRMSGTTKFKEEFVTAGGVDLREVNFKTFGLKRFPGLYCAGEVLNVDGVTGGFNFQAAWTGGHHVGAAVAKNATNAAR